MRVMWIVGLVPNKMGGFERLCLRWAQQNQADGIETEFVFEGAPCSELATQLTACGSRWHVVPEVGALGWRQNLALWRHLRERRPSVIHLHFCEMFCLFFVMADALHVPLIASYHYSGEPRSSRGIRRGLKRLRQRLLAGSIRRITAVSCAARDKLVADYLIASERVSIIYNGTDIDAGPAPAERNITKALPTGRQSRPAIVFVGALIPEKGADIAIRAVAALLDLPEARLTVVGEGPELANLQRLGATLGLGQRVEFLGRRNDVADILSQHDMLVVPSIWSEAFGYVVIEAMAAGCAAIASASGGIVEIITDCEDGLLVPPADCAALSSAIDRLWRDSELRARLVGNARRTVEARFTLAECVSRYRSLYSGLTPHAG
jgi:glycosyltransferase involved in cell wall biosynthesis